ncbi:MAG: SigB/SigF/SigG family RNA polymerase sigma factor [Acidimicrobiia bacterium]
MEDEELQKRFEEYRRTGERVVRNDLVEEYRWVAAHCARRFSHRSEPMDDLLQVAMLGVLKAVDRFDPGYGVRFPTFAIPTVMGELRRHFRDKTWSVHVPRRMKDAYLDVSAASEQLGHDLGRPPSTAELADYLDTSPDEVREAVEIGAAYRAGPLALPTDGRDDNRTERDVAAIGDSDHDLTLTDVRVSVREAVAQLPDRERSVVYLRFYEGLTQSEIAERVGCSQVHVSRVLRATLERLGDGLGEAGERRPCRAPRSRPVRLPASAPRA